MASKRRKRTRAAELIDVQVKRVSADDIETLRPLLRAEDRSAKNAPTVRWAVSKLAALVRAGRYPVES